MGERSRYAPNTFCWTDLTTTDPAAAEAFYGELLGWRAADRPPGEGYGIMLRDGHAVAGIAPQRPEQAEAGATPAWTSYVAVADADLLARRAQGLGAARIVPGTDVVGGRMAVLEDPQGAVLALWQAREQIGATLVNAPGAMTWNELASPTPEDSAAFYRNLFGWTIASASLSHQRYLAVRNGGANNGGIREATGAEPPHWLVYFGTDDLAGALETSDRLGGALVAGPIDIRIAMVAIMRDPQGATFALYDGAMEP